MKKEKVKLPTENKRKLSLDSYSSSESEEDVKWNEVDSSENENFNCSVPKKFKKGEEAHLLHYAGNILYHSQDKEYYNQKQNYIKKFESKKLFKTVFREDQDSEFFKFNPAHTFQIESEDGGNVFSELIRCHRILHKSLKMELKNIASNKIDNSYVFASSFRFKNFSTHLENHKLSKASGKLEFYRQDMIPNLGSYDSDNETSKTLKKSWQELDFIDINAQIKKFFKTGGLDNNIEKINEIISLLFIAETNRNPATYITAPIFLELLAAEKINLKENNDSSNIKAFPMQMKGAVSGTRSLYKLHLEELKFKYDYLKGSTQESDSLFDKENKLFEKWLKFKQIKSKPKEWNPEIQKLILDWYGIAIKLEAAGDKKDNFGEDSEENISPHKNDQGFQKQEILVQNLIQKCIEYDKYHLSNFANSYDLNERKGFLESLKYWYIEPIVKILIDSKEELSEHSVLHILKLVLQDIECTHYGNTIFYGSGTSKDFLEINKIFYETTLTFKEIKRVFLTVDYIIKEYLSHIEHQETEIFGLSQESTQMTYNDFSYNQANYTNFIKYTQSHNDAYDNHQLEVAGDVSSFH